MTEFGFYTKLGLQHVLDFAAYDHILFLFALATPFVWKDWKKVLFLATVFTISHCISLALAVYNIVQISAELIEFLIPVTILCTAVFNLWTIYKNTNLPQFKFHLWATAFFGLIHGFGFSNYFRIFMAEEEEKAISLVGFAFGIELAQLTIILAALALAFVLLDLFKLKRSYYIVGISSLILAITIPLLIGTLP